MFEEKTNSGANETDIFPPKTRGFLALVSNILTLLGQQTKVVSICIVHNLTFSRFIVFGKTQDLGWYRS